MAADKGARNVRARTVAANGALVINPEDTYIILLNSSDAATKTATFPTKGPADATGGPMCTVVLKLRSSTGNYTIPCTNGAVVGNVLLDAAAEGAEFVRIGTVLHLVTLLGTATFS